MNKSWHYYRTCLGFGPDAPRAIELDIKNSPQEHYSFIFRSARTDNGPAIKVTATWEYFDKRTYFLIPANKDASLEDITTWSEYEERTARAYLKGAGITAANWDEFLAAGRAILDK